MIYETVVTTLSEDGEPHLAPMGVRYEGEQVLMMPFRPSRTLDNVLSSGRAVLNLTTDVRVFAGCVTGRKNWPTVAIDGFAGRRLELDEETYLSATSSNHRNRAISRLLHDYKRLYFDPAETTDLYTRQCCLNASARDLAVMAATLADGGVNPITRERVVDAVHCDHALVVMATAGMYETSGDWLFDLGVPGKSGVSGGIIAVAPGKGALGAFAPPLDAAGNSVRGQLAARFLSNQLGMNLFASKPVGE